METTTPTQSESESIGMYLRLFPLETSLSSALLPMTGCVDLETLINDIHHVVVFEGFVCDNRVNKLSS